VESVNYDHTESILAEVSGTWWLSHAVCAFVLCCFVHKDNKDIFTHVTDIPAGRTRDKVRLDKSELIGEACTVVKALHPVTHGDVKYKLKKVCIEGMNSQIDKNNIANIFNQIKIMKEQEEMLVMAYGKEHYKLMVLGLMHGLPGLMKLQVSQEDEAGTDEDNDNNNDN